MLKALLAWVDRFGKSPVQDVGTPNSKSTPTQVRKLMRHPVVPLIINQFYLVHLQKVSYVLSRGDERDGVGAAVGAQPLLDDGHEEVVGVRRLLAALHQQSVG